MFERERLLKELHAFRHGVRSQPPMSGQNAPDVHTTLQETHLIGQKSDVSPECMIPSEWVDTVDETATTPQSDNSDIFDQSLALRIDQARCAMPGPTPESPAPPDMRKPAPGASKDHPDRRLNRDCAEGENAQSDRAPQMPGPGNSSEAAFSMWSLPVI